VENLALKIWAEIYVRNREGILVLELRTALLMSGNHQAHKPNKGNKGVAE
jgi:hypothetical protein